MGKVMRHTLGASLNIRHNLSSSKGPKPLQLKLLTTYIPKTSAFTLAFSTSQRLRTTRASARTFFTFRHYITPSARNFCLSFSSASVRTSVFPARTHKINANNSAALTGRSTPLIMFSVNSAPSMMRQAVKAAELFAGSAGMPRSEERFSRNAETDLVCRLLLEKKKHHPVHHTSANADDPSH